MTRIPTIPFIGLLLALSCQGFGADPTSNEESAGRYRELIRRLVSPNEKPHTKNGETVTVRFPEGYDLQAQERIRAVCQQLQDHFDEALPYLVEALDDNRYCMTIDWMHGDGYYNWSVGKVCRHVIESQLEVYRGKIAFSGPWHWHQYDYTPISKQWWESRKGQSVATLQVEAIDWAIDRRKNESGQDIQKDRTNEIPEMQKLRDEIVKSGKPVKPMKMQRMAIPKITVKE